MKISELVTFLDSYFPSCYAESYDNCGLLISTQDVELKGVLIALDCTEELINKAIAEKCNFILTHHPLIFHSVKKITPNSYTERLILKAIQHNISIYAAHTNADVLPDGVTWQWAKKMELQELKVLSPQTGLYKKVVVYVPQSFAEKVRDALFSAGAGTIGNYQYCSFTQEGKGTFHPLDNAHPYIGKVGSTETVHENKVEVLVMPDKLSSVISAIYATHPYEEPAFDILPLDNYSMLGFGVVGKLTQAMLDKDFLCFLKDKMNLSHVRHSILQNKPIQKVALCGGSGSNLLNKALSLKADIFISSEFKHNHFVESLSTSMTIVDVGHYDSEKYILNYFREIVSKKITTFAVPILLENQNFVCSM